MAKKSPPKKAPARAGAVDTKITFLVSDEDHEAVALRQRSFLGDVANKVENGNPLNDLEAKFAAGAIRAFAESIPLRPKRKQGPQPKFCHGSEAMVYASYRVQGMKHGHALVMISDRVGVSEQAIEKGIRKYRPGAFAMFGMKDPGNQ